MARMTLATLLLFVVATSGLCAISQEKQQTLESHEFTLENVAPGDVAASLRTIVGTRAITLVGGPFVTIRDSKADMVLAKSLIAWIDQPLEGEGTARTFLEDVEDSTILGIRLQHAQASEVMKALREVVNSSRVVGSNQGRFVLVRDSAEKVQAARDLIERMDQAPASD